MTMTLTPERQKLKQDAIRLRQEMGWSIRRIAGHLKIAKSAVGEWLSAYSTHELSDNLPLSFNQVHVMDCVDGMGKLPHESIDLVFADPPYNLGVSYGNGHFSTDRHAAYIEWSHRWFEAVYRILKPGGSFYVMQYPEVCALWLPRLTAIFTFQRWITWHYPTNIGQAPNNWTRSHRAILFCTKGIEPNYFDGIADAQPYRNPTDKRIKELIANGAPGVTPYDTWAYNLVKNVSEDKTSWPNQIPVQLIERIIKVSCPKDGIACDPFMGSGSTAVAAVKNGRTWIGFDTLDISKRETERRCEI